RPRISLISSSPIFRQLKYGVPVAVVSCLKMGEDEIKEILGLTLNQFPVREVGLDLPGWLVGLEKEHPARCAVMACIRDFAGSLKKMGDIGPQLGRLSGTEFVENVFRGETDLGKGSTSVAIALPQKLFYKILEEKTGLGIAGEDGLMPCMIDLAAIKRKYERIKGALDQVEAAGYGIVMPTMEELSLQEPEIVRRGGKYGIRLRASAPSIHMMRADITTEVSPIVGSEKQSEELVNYLMKEFEEDPTKIWQSNIFGKSLHELVNEGLRNKLSRMPQEARLRLQETIERIINEGCSGLICIIL
ncbi:MAG TPA: stage IV sporulation protein A, partial [Oscillospiraceae bacterium]|nr:stage IV sporulation protein A [Oscillospiraceae bacterium]